MGISYFQRPLGPGHILDFVKAPSARVLRERMLKNNIKHKGFVVYQDVQFNSKDGQWYAWYYAGSDLFEAAKDVAKVDDGE